ncbi:Transcription factor IBH1 [Linum grandiflorum]
MARAVGSRRVWSRALLSRIRARRAHTNMPKSRKPMSRTEKLRKLVPGGRKMEMGKLLEETAHYVQCLAVQVRVMQTIADRLL